MGDLPVPAMIEMRTQVKRMYAILCNGAPESAGNQTAKLRCEVLSRSLERGLSHVVNLHPALQEPVRRHSYL